MSKTATQRPVARPASRWWLRLGLLFALLWVGAALLWLAVDSIPYAPLHVTIDGDEVLSGIDLAAFDPAHKVAVVVAVLVALVVALIVVPIALVVALIALTLVLLLTVGLPLLAVLGVAGLLLSPLILLGWLLWRALRPPPSSTIAA